jgi:oligopeptide transport system substrate-binding protein
MKRSKGLLSLIALVLVLSTVLAACGGNNGGNASPTNAPATNDGGNNSASNDGAAEGEEVLAADQNIKINLTSEPPTFDPQQAQDSTSNAVLKLMYEGLTRVNDETGQPVEGMATDWEISPDGLVYTFNLRDAQWSNGDPVTANDFVFAWQRVLDPEAADPAPYAYQLYYLANAEAYNTGEIADFEQVGVKALDDKTLEVTLANPTPYFLGLLSFYTYYPVHSSAADNAQWATKVDSQIVNGPFTLTEWTTGQSLAVTKNPNYYAADDIKAETITFSIVSSGATELLSYRNGEIDRAGGPIGDIPLEQLPIVEKELPNEFARKGIAAVYYYQINLTEKPFTNANIRKALAMAINRQGLIDNITLGGQLPAFGFVPTGIQSNGEEFRAQVDHSQYFSEDLEQAKTLLAQGLAEEGLDTLSFTLTYNTSEGHAKIATAVADMWKQSLGVDVKLENKEWGIFLEERHNLNYQVARSGWSADYNDPMTFLDMFVSNSGNNDMGYNNPEFDKLIQEAKTSSDNAVRQEKFVAAEKMLMDEMAIIPVYYYSNNSLTKPYLKGVTLDFSGAVDLSRAYKIEQ